MRRLVLALAVLAGLLLSPTAEAAVVPGPNGPLVITSGRDDGATTLSDNLAQIWFLSGPGGGALRLSPSATSHHRHASWSPDRTKIAYATGPDDPDFNGPWDIFVQDLANPGAALIPITNTALNEDRPTWSPDGTRLAYAKQTGATAWDVVTKSSDGTGAETTVVTGASTGTGASGQFSRPQWSPDGQTIFYGRTITATPQDYDIYRAAADGSQSTLGGTPVVAGTGNDYQPALAPDGENLCFTRQGATKDIFVVPSTGGAGASLVAESGDEYECAWSPDDSNIAFVRGAFSNGEIRLKNLESNDLSDPVTNVLGVFDGNPEWTRNPPPTCTGASVDVPFNGFVRIPLNCTDEPDPPSFQDSPPDLEIASGPSFGTIGGINDDRTVIYTPNANFQGSDTFTFTSSDGTTTTQPATIVLNVARPGQDDAATISDVRVQRRRWRRGPGLAVEVSARRGTRISWRLSEDAATTLTFQRARPGRRVRGRCVRPTPRRRSRPRCKRFVSVRPALRFPDAHAGLNTIRFQGRLTRRKRLRLGTYRVVVGATDSAGNVSERRRSRTFRIVRR